MNWIPVSFKTNVFSWYSLRTICDFILNFVVDSDLPSSASFGEVICRCEIKTLKIPDIFAVESRMNNE